MKKLFQSLACFNARCNQDGKRDYVRWLLAALAVALAWTQRFIQDDAFISFRYARSLAAGHGLIWNLGERVEGYTNFLWTVCMTPAFWLGVDVVAWGHAVSLAAFAVTLCVSSRLAETWWRNRVAGWLAILFLSCNYSFLHYATGGLETQFGIAWVMLGIWLLQSERHVFAALATACAVMTRMDAVLLLFPFWCAAAWRVWSGAPAAGTLSRNLRFARLCLAAMCGAVPVVAWLLWRHNYYGAWVPNTWLIKSGGPTALRGLAYVVLFYALSGIFLTLPLVVAMRRELPRMTGFFAVLAAWLLWQAYLVRVGGDFMEFRMMMPVTPFIMIVLSGLLATPGARGWLRMATAASLLFMSAILGIARQQSLGGVGSFAESRQVHAEWTYYARELQRLLGGQCGGVKIAITAAGIIPFYTQMPALDQLGLNDREIALAGDAITPMSKWLGNRPGHTRMARWETLVEKNTNLVINHPWVVDKDDPALNCTAEQIARFWFYYEVKDFSRKPCFATFITDGHEVPPTIAWPLGNGQFWLMIYITPHPAVDAAIERSGARVILPRTVEPSAGSGKNPEP